METALLLVVVVVLVAGVSLAWRRIFAQTKRTGKTDHDKSKAKPSGKKKISKVQQNRIHATSFADVDSHEPANDAAAVLEFLKGKEFEPVSKEKGPAKQFSTGKETPNEGNSINGEAENYVVIQRKKARDSKKSEGEESEGIQVTDSKAKKKQFFKKGVFHQIQQAQEQEKLEQEDEKQKPSKRKKDVKDDADEKSNLKSDKEDKEAGKRKESSPKEPGKEKKSLNKEISIMEADQKSNDANQENKLHNHLKDTKLSRNKNSPRIKDFEEEDAKSRNYSPLVPPKFDKEFVAADILEVVDSMASFYGGPDSSFSSGRASKRERRTPEQSDAQWQEPEKAQSNINQYKKKDTGSPKKKGTHIRNQNIDNDDTV